MKLIEVTPSGALVLTADSAIVDRGRPVFIPELEAPQGWTLRVCRAWRIGRLGKCIGEKFAPRYVDASAYLVRLLPAGPPALGSDARYATFDGAIALGVQVDAGYVPQAPVLRVGDAEFAIGPAASTMEQCVAAASRSITLRTGDIVASPAACSPPLPAVGPDTHVEIRDAGRILLKYNIK